MSHKFFAAVLFFSSLMIFSCKWKDHKHQTDEHLTHEFVAVEGTPIFDVPQDSTFDVNKVGTVSFNGYQAYYLKRNFDKRLITDSGYVYQMPRVFVRKNNLGNMKDVTVPFIDIYTKAQIPIVNSKIEGSKGFWQLNTPSYAILSCTTTGQKACYKMASLTASIETTTLGDVQGWEFPCHLHVPVDTVELRWVTFKDTSEINAFSEALKYPPTCHSLSFNNSADTLVVDTTIYLTYPYGSFDID